ncbi:disease resistance protein Pik-2-like [Phragmites australis]|uniref:disease resistance protein Pik-2-like n=1 Tax=Phragmites australis TaxID=29695 RepID=UPI002D76D52E|nr:disease resistance protein Pik-2-like [Phragmites australis]XP_062217440.1 disease resistance protein Pik-2-like [Phragmites australis]
MELAVGASESAMSSLLGKLGSLLAQEYTLISGVRSEIQYMNDELASMHAFLRKLARAAAAGAAHDEQTKDWTEQVRDVAYDIEDCVDDFAHRLGHQPRGEGLLINLRRAWYTMATLWSRRDIAAKIIDLKKRAQDVGERRSRYGVQDPKHDSKGKSSGTPRPYTADHQPAAPQLVGTTKLVGQDKDIVDHGQWLTEPRPECDERILAIVGFGGLGKTTMAQELLRRFGEKFEYRASVQVSRKLNLPSLLRSILNQVTPQKEPERKNDGGGGPSESRVNGTEGWSVQQLKLKLKTQLEQKRYLLLIDDVWSVSSWRDIWESLPRNKKGSSIVVTTRFKSVANACCYKQDRIHMLKPLRGEESKILFFERIHDPEPTKFKEIKEEIIKKCAGLPLAILTVAGLLARRDLNESSHWKTVEESLNSELEKNLSPEGVTHILNLCYNDLPADQKNCLLYLSIFPKGCSIHRKRLTKRWIAEGFIIEKDGKTVEEVADDTFNDLISRNIVRPVEHSSNGKVKACQVHDMILEYIVSKSSEENFITVVGGHLLTPTPSNKVRRLSLHSSNPEDAKEKMESMNLSHVRSLTVFENFHHLPSYSFKSGILQVLELEGCKSLNTNQLDKICKMFHLKYLSLRKVYIKKLPSEIGKLQYLETLDIRETNVTYLPSSIGRLQKMVHLLGGNKSTRRALRFTEEIANMTALQTLSGIEISTSSTRDLGSMHNLTKLKKLSIYNLRDLDANSHKYDLLSAIEYLSGFSLKSLAIDDGFTGFLNSMDDLSTPPKYILSLDLSGKLLHVPKWIKELETLENLTLSLTSLQTEGLLLLSRLPLLFSLTFSVIAKGHDRSIVKILEKNTMDSGGKIFVPPGGFVRLKLLRFSAPVMPLLSFLEGAMPELQRLELQFRILEGAYGLENPGNLQQVNLTVSQQASEATKVKVSDIRSSVGMHQNKPTVVVDEYYE